MHLADRRKQSCLVGIEYGFAWKLWFLQPQALACATQNFSWLISCAGTPGGRKISWLPP
jgi:hypothetical protein